MIQQRVTKYIEKEHLFSPDDKILVALSGGADSVALLYILHTAFPPARQRVRPGRVICPPTLRKNGNPFTYH